MLMNPASAPRRPVRRAALALCLGAGLLVSVSATDADAQRRRPGTPKQTVGARLGLDGTGKVPTIATVKAKAKAQEGLATYYAGFFHGRRTASGTIFDSTEMVAAHPTLPFGTRVRVHNVRSGKSVVVRVTDRGPAKGPQKRGIIIDLSHAAAQRLGFISAGRTKVRLETLAAADPE